MTQSVVGIIQARMSSKRLPGKVLRALVDEKSILEVLCQRLTASRVKWWIATTRKEVDDPIADLAHRLGFSVFRGSEDNVLLRFLGVLELTKADWFVRVTADNPFTSGEVVDSLVAKVNLVSRDTNRIWAEHPKAGYPLGFVPEVVRTAAIRRLALQPGIFGSHHASHVTSALEKRASLGIDIGHLPPRPHWRWTVDTAADLKMAREAFRLFHLKWPVVGYSEMVGCLTAFPEITAINQAERQKNPEER